MSDKNREFFRRVYPQHWLSSRQLRSYNQLHYKYQEITLDRIECFDGCKLLECGCGSGELLDRLHLRHANTTLLGLDIGHESLVWAQGETAKRGHQGIHLAESDVRQLPLPSNHFDRVLCSSVLWYVQSPAFVISEMIRVLKPGGRFVFDVRNPYHITNQMAELSLKLRRALGKMAPAYSFYSPARISKLLQTLPVQFDIEGFFVLLPTRLPLLGTKWGNWVQWSPWLAFRAGHGPARWFAQKLLVSGQKLQ